jgi:hypothetical protein
MRRSLFFLITAILGFLFGAMMLIAPDKAAEGFGWPISPPMELLFRSLGGLIVAAGILNLLVRNSVDSKALRGVFMFNVAFHGISMIIDVLGVSQGILAIDKIIPGQVVHLFIGVGSLIYWSKIK